MGLLGRMLFGPTPANLEILAWWSVGTAAVGVALGLLFPKAVACVCFPFATFGAGT
jgi:hypothetical protein